jgi:hypothetical protein
LIALLLLLCEVSAPLGPYARPGVPVPLVVDAKARGMTDYLEVDGQRYFLLRPVTLVHPAALPCRVSDASGKELLRLEPVPEGRTLVGTTGAGDDAADGPLRVQIDLRALGALHWPCLDLFDVVEAPGEAIADRWHKAGGGRIPRTGNVLPEVYDGLPAPVPAARVWPTARLFLLAFALVLAAQLLLRARLGPLAAVALAATLLGAVVTRQKYDPLARARIEIVYRPAASGPARVRMFDALSAVGPGARADAPEGAGPVFYQSGNTGWFRDDGSYSLEPGVTRLFVRDVLADRPPLREGAHDGALTALISLFEPKKGRWEVRAGANRIEFTAVD